MLSLPHEVVHQIVDYLDSASRWRTARVCKKAYALVRPSLFRSLELEFTIVNGIPPSDQLAKLREHLASANGVGHLVRKLGLRVKIEHTADLEPQNSVSSTLGILLGMTPRLEALDYYVVSGRVPRETSQSRDNENAVLHAAVMQASQLKSVSIDAQSDTDPFWWIHILLSCFSQKVQKCSMDTQVSDSIVEAAGLDWMMSRYKPEFRTGFNHLRFLNIGRGRVPAALLDFLLASSPLVETMEVFLTDAMTPDQVSALFGPNRAHKVLTLANLGMPQLPLARTGLQQQIQLTRVTLIDPLSHFLFYYSPDLPPSIVDLEISEVYVNCASREEPPFPSLSLTFDLVKVLLGKATWCPRLARLSLSLTTEVRRKADWKKTLVKCGAMRKELRGLLFARAIQPETDKTFWKLENDHNFR